MSSTSKNKYKSGLEIRFAEELTRLRTEFSYETEIVSYIQPEEVRSYKPDFICYDAKDGHKIIIETKGLFSANDRKKHLLIKQCHPSLDIRFVFQRNNKLTKRSKNRYSDWCEEHGFQYCILKMPRSWKLRKRKKGK